MVTASYIVKESIEVDLPRAASGGETVGPTLSFAIDKAGALYLDGQPVTRDGAPAAAVRAALRKSPEARALIGADKAVGPRRRGLAHRPGEDRGAHPLRHPDRARHLGGDAVSSAGGGRLVDGDAGGDRGGLAGAPRRRAGPGLPPRAAPAAPAGAGRGGLRGRRPPPPQPPQGRTAPAPRSHPPRAGSRWPGFPPPPAATPGPPPPPPSEAPPPDAPPAKAVPRVGISLSSTATVGRVRGRRREHAPRQGARGRGRSRGSEALRRGRHRPAARGSPPSRACSSSPRSPTPPRRGAPGWRGR